MVLQTVSRDKLDTVSADPSFRDRVAELLREQREAEQVPRWFQTAHPNSPLKTVAYFSMEYMLSEALPIYSGGLGNVAGDQLKAASDLGVPVVGVGLLYQQGYFRQDIDSAGNQLALYPFNDPGQLPIRPLRQSNGEWLRLQMSFPGFKIWIRAWQVQVGRARLYLLDTNDPANPAYMRGITSELYGGGPELRIRQEQLLGIGGWRLLRALNVQPDVCHLNEGHAAFAILERARSFMVDNKKPFDVALAATRAGNLFTTHTPVEAGFDRFSPELMKTFFQYYAEDRLGISLHNLMALGRRNQDDASEPFNMAYLALRGSSAVNGVSRLHGEVSRRIFQTLFPRWPQADVPVGHVTNGIHGPTWESAAALAQWDKACGEDRWMGSIEGIGANLRKIGDADLWGLRNKGSKALVEYARGRLAHQRASRSAPREKIEEAARIFDSNALTLGFARRFAPYKRPNLLLHDPERLVRILTNPLHPAQLILAGKAHPQDRAGQDMIRQWSDFIKRADVSSRVVFLSDYDMLMTQQLVQGVDVWLNTPRRPWEASGTSGMKVLVNCGLNLSELDGWWAEAYTPEVGWAIGDGKEHGDDPGWDAAEADALYMLIEREIVPEFYDRDREGIPRRWVSRMRESMARLAPQFSASRTVREYTEKHYLPAAAACRERSADGGKLGEELLRWQREIATHWHRIRFGAVTIEQRGGEYFYELQLYFEELDPDWLRVELYADAREGAEPTRQRMTRQKSLAGGYVYSASVPADRPAGDYTPRVRACRSAICLPLESPQILWQK